MPSMWLLWMRRAAEKVCSASKSITEVNGKSLSLTLALFVSMKYFKKPFAC